MGSLQVVPSRQPFEPFAPSPALPGTCTRGKCACGASVVFRRLSLRNLRIAFGLMTTLPFRLPEDWSAGDSGRASIGYPFVGLVVGALTWLVWKGALSLFSPLIAGVMALILWV